MDDQRYIKEQREDLNRGLKEQLRYLDNQRKTEERCVKDEAQGMKAQWHQMQEEARQSAVAEQERKVRLAAEVKAFNLQKQAELDEAIRAER